MAAAPAGLSRLLQLIDRSPRRGHLNAERSDGVARHGAAPRGRATAAPRGGKGGPGLAVALPPRSRLAAERGRRETHGVCSRPEEPAGPPLQGECCCRQGASAPPLLSALPGRCKASPPSPPLILMWRSRRGGWIGVSGRGWGAGRRGQS